IGELVKTGFQKRTLISGAGNKPVEFGSPEALEHFAGYLGLRRLEKPSRPLPSDLRKAFDPEDRQVRQVRELTDHVQWVLRVSDYERNRFFLHRIMPEWADKKWSTKSYHPYLDPGPFEEKLKP